MSLWAGDAFSAYCGLGLNTGWKWVFAFSRTALEGHFKAGHRAFVLLHARFVTRHGGTGVTLTPSVCGTSFPEKHGLTKPRLKQHPCQQSTVLGSCKPFSALGIRNGSGIQSGSNTGAEEGVKVF